MNIFLLDLDPETCASYHNDRHVVKMILESCQLLSTAHRVNDGTQYRGTSATGRNMIRWRLDDSIKERALYQATHINHPCALWCRATEEQYMWLWNLTVALSKEYTFRYGKIHKCERDGLIDLLQSAPRRFQTTGWYDPAQAMPDDCKHANPIMAYRQYYQMHKQHLARWTKRTPPAWYSASVA